MLIAALVVAKLLRLLLWTTTTEAASQCYSTGNNPATTLTCNTTCYVAVYDAEDDHFYRGCGTLEHDPEKVTVGMLHVYFCNDDLCNAGNPFGKTTSNSTEPVLEKVKVAPLTEENELLYAVGNITTTIAAFENVTDTETTETSIAEGSTSRPTTEASGATTIVVPSGATTTPGPSGSTDEWSTTTSAAGTTLRADHDGSPTQADGTTVETTTSWSGSVTSQVRASGIIDASVEPTTVIIEDPANDASATTALPTTIHSLSVDSSSSMADLTTVTGVTERTTTPGRTASTERIFTASTTGAITTKSKASIRTSRDNETTRDATVMNANSTSTSGTTAQPAAETTTAKQGVSPDEWTTANASNSTEAAVASIGNASSAERQNENSTSTKWTPSNASVSNTNGSMASKEMHTLAASNVVAPASVNAAGVSTPERQTPDSEDEVTLGNGATSVGKIGILTTLALMAVFLR